MKKKKRLDDSNRNAVFAGMIRSAGGTSIIGTIPYNKLSHDLGGFREKILPGAFQTKERDIKLLWAHDASRPLASTAGGTLTLADGPRALTVIAHLDPTSTIHSDVLTAVKRRDASGLSFGFKIPEGGDSWTQGPNGERIRELREIICREFSIVTFPAYPDSAAAVRKEEEKPFITQRRNKTMTLAEKRNEIGRVLMRIRALEAKESIDAVEESELRTLESAYDELEKDIKREELRERNDERERWLNSSQRKPTKPQPDTRHTDDSREDRNGGRFQTPEGGYRSEFLRSLRSLSMDGSDGGGQLVLPVQMGNEVIVDIEDDLPVFKACDKLRVPKACRNILILTISEPPLMVQWISMNLPMLRQKP